MDIILREESVERHAKWTGYMLEAVGDFWLLLRNSFKQWFCVHEFLVVYYTRIQCLFMSRSHPHWGTSKNCDSVLPPHPPDVTWVSRQKCSLPVAPPHTHINVLFPLLVGWEKNRLHCGGEVSWGAWWCFLLILRSGEMHEGVLQIKPGRSDDIWRNKIWTPASTASKSHLHATWIQPI